MLHKPWYSPPWPPQPPQQICCRGQPRREKVGSSLRGPVRVGGWCVGPDTQPPPPPPPEVVGFCVGPATTVPKMVAIWVRGAGAEDAGWHGSVRSMAHPRLTGG